MNDVFVEGWDVIQVLGEGTYGEVKLLVNSTTQEAVAVKHLDTSQDESAAELIKKEVLIHRRLKHEHILRYFGHRVEGDVYYLFLEYAPGGELFDRIEPDVGMPQAKAQRYFYQIVKGVEFLHAVGIAHRDLKPENILLDKNDNVKISDFGMATLFRHKGNERILTTRCGTMPYVAPEVFFKRYRAEPADIWSCGILLVVMLAGEMPWNEATSDCFEFAAWKKSDFSISPWTKIDNLALGFLVKILTVSPNKRYTIPQILKHLWFRKFLSNKSCNIRCSQDLSNYKRLRSDLNISGSREELDIKISASQPAHLYKESETTDTAGPFNNITVGVSFSQPVDPDNMILATQFTSSPSVTKAGLPIGTRLTRFCVSKDADASSLLKEAFDKLGYCWKRCAPGQLTVTTQDRRNMQLIFKASLLPMPDTVLVDFRRSRGDGIEFKRHFLKIKELMGNVIDKQPLIGSNPSLKS